MFAALMCLALGLFAPTILLPILREHCELLAEEARLTRRIAELERETRHRSDLAEAFAHDAVINERLAMLDLRYRKPNEVVLPVVPRADTRHATQPLVEPPSECSLRLPSHWPSWAHDARDRADAYGLTDRFLDPALRPVFLLMSVGLVIAAFVLSAPRPRRRNIPPTTKQRASAPVATQQAG